MRAFATIRFLQRFIFATRFDQELWKERRWKFEIRVESLESTFTLEALVRCCAAATKMTEERLVGKLN